MYGKGQDDIYLYFAPGRVNLIGEHTDYNNGFVLPCALSFGTFLAIRKTSAPYLEFHSEGFDYQARIPLSGTYKKSGEHWVNYPLAVTEMFAQEGLETGGLQFYYSGNIPPASGLSSSASIEMVTAYALNDLYQWNYNIHDLIHLCKKAENEFIGVNCGIMDQFAVGQGRKEHAIFLDCGTLDFRLVPVRVPGYRLVITNTSKKRGLGESKYNERVEECRKAVAFLAKSLEINSLGEVGYDLFIRNADLIGDETVLKRARHIVTENHRVTEAVKALSGGDLDYFGQLMVQSHDSLRDDYEVTGFELDSLVEISLGQKGVLGARMTGAGFGGCTVAFVKGENLEEFMAEVSAAYLAKTGLKAVFYLPEIGDGVKKL
ncbi:MAG: galactokinase [Bacteroidales bacterium]|nr:galactokinase [Bacteroidales bacterium]